MTDETEVYAVPGRGSIIDVINPLTGLTQICGDTEAGIKAREPLAVRVRWVDWQADQARQQQTPIVWERTTAAEYVRMLEILPPVSWAHGAFLVGEPTDHDILTGAPRFQAYRKNRGYWRSSRAITVAELRKELNK